MHPSPLNRRELLLGLLASAAAGPALANKTWPSKAIKIVVPGPAGSGGDIFARLLLPALQGSLKEPLFVENKVGANGIIGNDNVAKAQPDGYTVLFTASSSIAINPIIQARMPYDAQRDLTPVAQVGAAGILLVANPATGLKTLADMVKYAKANPGKLAYGSWGSGSTGHLAMEGIKAHYGLDMPHVPYKGTSVELGDLLANNIGVGFMDIASPVPHIKSGKLVALGATGSARGPALPEVPTISEQGYKFDADGWYGIFVPAKTDPQVVERLNAEFARVLGSDEVKKKFAEQNMLIPAHKTPAQFAQTVKEDMALWQQLAKVAKLKVD